jgi:hypothetical protein
MTISGVGERRRGWASGSVVRIALSLAMLAPTAVLFSLVWQPVGEQLDFGTLERHGVKYLQALVPLEIALTSAESAAVSGGTVPRDSLTRALDAAARVDTEFGGELRTHDRWTELRTKIEAVPTSLNGAKAYSAYGEVADLLLALMDKVRNNAKLARDPVADTYYLQDGAAQELPEAIVAAARFTDLLVIGAGLPAGDQAQSQVDIASARSDLSSNAHDLSDDVRLAVEGAGSRSIDSTLLSKLDRFNRSIDALTPLTKPGQGGARDEMQSAAADLSAVLLAQIDTALQSRLSTLDRRRLVAGVTLALAILLAVAPLALVLAGRRRARAAGAANPTSTPISPRSHQAGPQHAAPQPGASQPGAIEPNQWPGGPTRPDPADAEYAQWERFGVSR